MAKRAQGIGRILGYAREYRSAYVVGGIALLATNVFQLGVPWYLKQAIEAVRASAPMSTVSWAAASMAVAATLQAVSRIASRSIVYWAGRNVESRLRDDVTRHLMSLPPSFYDNHRTGDILSRAINDTSDIRMFVGAGFLQVCNTVIVYATTLSMMVYIDASLTLSLLAPYPFLFLAFNRFSRRTHDLYVQCQESLASMSTHLTEGLSRIMLIKAFDTQTLETEEFSRINGRNRDANLRLERVRGLFFPLVGGAMGVAQIVLLWIGGRRVIAGDLTLGEFVALNSYLAILVWPTIGFGWILNVLERGRAAVGRLDFLFAIESDVADGPDVVPLSEVKGDISVRGLTFAYANPEAPEEARRPVLEDIDLTLPAGSTLAIVGPTASGKTTLVHLLARLYPVPEGTVFLDGRDVNQIPSEQLRRALAYVPQDNALFSISIAENVAYGVPDVSMDAVRRAAKKAHLDSDVARFPQGYDTQVGERGVTLSGGQKQRVCIARALLREPAVIVLDDSLSSVDTETEERILRELRQFMEGRTCIFISHRISTVRWADRIVVLDEGRIVEQGTHGQLLGRGGIYAQMAAQQALSDALEGEG